MELPQIGPAGGIQPGPMVSPPTGSALGEISTRAEEVSRMAGMIGYWQQRQARINHFAMGDAEYVAGSSGIFEHARDYSDPNTRHEFITQSLQNLQKAIILAHPQAADKLTDQLSIRTEEDIRRSAQQSLEISDRNLKAQMTDVQLHSIIAASSTDNNADRQVAVDQYHGVLEEAVKNGHFTPAEAQLEWDKFNYNLRKADTERLAFKDPNAVLQLDLKDSGLKAQDFSDVKHMAANELERQNSMADKEFKGQSNAINLKILNGTATDQEVETAWRANIIDEKMYRYHFHHYPSNSSLSAQYTNSIDNWQGDAEGLRRWFGHYVAGSTDLETDDHRKLEFQYQDQYNWLKSAEGTNAQILKAQIKKRMDELGLTGSITDPFAAERDEHIQDLNTLTHSFKGQSIEEQNRAAKNFVDNLNKTVTVVPPSSSTRPANTDKKSGWFGGF